MYRETKTRDLSSSEENCFTVCTFCSPIVTFVVQLLDAQHATPVGIKFGLIRSVRYSDIVVGFDSAGGPSSLPFRLR